MLLGCLGLAAQTATTAEIPSVQLPPELARVLTDYEKAWTAKDAAALSKIFAEDGFVMSSDAPMVRGRAAIEKPAKVGRYFCEQWRTRRMAIPASSSAASRIARGA